MGYITTGKRLTEEHSFFSKRSPDQDNDMRPGIAFAPRPEQEEEHEEELDHDDDDEEHVAPMPEDDYDGSGDHFLEAESEDEFEDAQEYPNAENEDVQSDWDEAEY
jgi:hypothetical protein